MFLYFIICFCRFVFFFLLNSSPVIYTLLHSIIWCFSLCAKRHYTFWACVSSTSPNTLHLSVCCALFFFFLVSFVRSILVDGDCFFFFSLMNHSIRIKDLLLNESVCHSRPYDTECILLVPFLFCIRKNTLFNGYGNTNLSYFTL